MPPPKRRGEKGEGEVGLPVRVSFKKNGRVKPIIGATQRYMQYALPIFATESTPYRSFAVSHLIVTYQVRT